MNETILLVKCRWCETKQPGSIASHEQAFHPGKYEEASKPQPQPTPDIPVMKAKVSPPAPAGTPRKDRKGK